MLESYGPAVTQALRRLDGATTVARPQGGGLAEVTDEWQLGNHSPFRRVRPPAVVEEAGSGS